MPTSGETKKFRWPTLPEAHLELESRWVCDYWQPLNDEWRKQLIDFGGHGGQFVNRQKHWAAYGSLLVWHARKKEFGFDDDHGWTMVQSSPLVEKLAPSTISESHTPNETPVYIPTIGLQKMLARKLGIFKSDLEAHQKLRGTLTHAEWQRLKAVKEDWFDSCDYRYLEPASIIFTYFNAPYGLVTEEMTLEIAKKLGGLGHLERRAGSETKALWTTACLLEHSEVKPDTLAEFCARTLKFVPSEGHPQCLMTGCSHNERRKISSIQNDEGFLELIKANMRVKALDFGTLVRGPEKKRGSPLKRAFDHGSSGKRKKIETTTIQPVPTVRSVPANQCCSDPR